MSPEEWSSFIGISSLKYAQIKWQKKRFLLELSNSINWNISNYIRVLNVQEDSTHYIKTGKSFWRYSMQHTICPGSSGPFYIVPYYIKWVTTSWTHSTHIEICK